MDTFQYRLDVNDSRLWHHDDEDLSLWWRHEFFKWAASEAQALGYESFAVCDVDNTHLQEGQVIGRA